MRVGRKKRMLNKTKSRVKLEGFGVVLGGG